MLIYPTHQGLKLCTYTVQEYVHWKCHNTCTINYDCIFREGNQGTYSSRKLLERQRTTIKEKKTLVCPILQPITDTCSQAPKSFLTNWGTNHPSGVTPQSLGFVPILACLQHWREYLIRKAPNITAGLPRLDLLQQGLGKRICLAWRPEVQNSSQKVTHSLS